MIAIDGGAGTGKGTARMGVAKKLGFNAWDSGLLYRALGLQVAAMNLLCNNQRIIELASSIQIQLVDETVLVNSEDVTSTIRSDEAGKSASIVAQIPEVRAIFHQMHLAQRKMPGLVADGRDMGFVFDTPYRFFLTTSPEERARRRVLQFERMKILWVDYDSILLEILRRDESDKNNPANQLRPHPEATIIDTTDLKIGESAEIIVESYRSFLC